MKHLKLLFLLGLLSFSFSSFGEKEGSGGFFFSQKMRIDIGMGAGLNSGFQDILFYQMGMAFLLNEDWSLEYRFENYSISNSDEVKNLSLIGGIPFLERLRRSHSLGVVYSPFDGDLRVWGSKYPFRLYLGLGVSYLDLEDNLNSFNGVAFQESFRSFKKWGGSWKIGSRIKVTSLFSVYFELMSLYHISNELDGVKEKELVSRLYLQLGGSLRF